MSTRQHGEVAAYLTVWEREYGRVYGIAKWMSDALTNLSEETEDLAPRTDTLSQSIVASRQELRRVSKTLASAPVPQRCTMLHADTLDALAALDRALGALLPRLDRGGDATGEVMAIAEALKQIAGLAPEAARL